MRSAKAFTLIELMIVIAIIAVIASIAIPGLIAAQRSANQRNCSATIKTLPTAQADFRSNDRDGDQANNYWSDNLQALYTLTPSPDGINPGPGTTAAMIKLIEASVATAEGENVPATAGIVAPAAGLATIRLPKSNYLFSAFGVDELGIPYNEAAGTSSAYQGSHNFGKFAYLAVPISRGAGAQVFMVSESATIYLFDLPTNFTGVYSTSWAAAGLTVANLTMVGTNTHAMSAAYPTPVWPPITTGPINSFGGKKLD